MCHRMRACLFHGLVAVACATLQLAAQAQTGGAAGTPSPTKCVAVKGHDYDVGDLVQVRIRGLGWVDGVISSVALGIDNEYRVKVSGDRVAIATANDLCFVATAQADRAKRMAGKPPKPGLASCAGKFEGRYASAAGAVGLVTLTFRSGRATLRMPDVVAHGDKVTSLTSEQEAECWTGEGKIFLVWTDGSDFDFPIDINDDGTLDTPYGELRKKGN